MSYQTFRVEITRDETPLAYVADPQPETGRLAALWPAAAARVVVRAGGHHRSGS